MDFRNTVVIMTSNPGSDLIQERFGELITPYGRIWFWVVSHNFRPEFINRIDEVVVFHPLGEKHIASIAQIQLQRLYKRLEERGYEIHISDDALKLLSEKWLRSGLRARPLKRAIQQQIENPLAQQDTVRQNWFGQSYPSGKRRPNCGSAVSSGVAKRAACSSFLLKKPGQNEVWDVICLESEQSVNNFTLSQLQNYSL